MAEEPEGAAPAGDRREFVKKAVAMAVGGAAAVPPIVAGLAVVFDPARGAATDAQVVKVATLDALPADGVPRRFAVVASLRDAWNRFPAVPVGAVYLRRTGEREVVALSVICPHAGCFVDYLPARGGFFCPCHNSSFALDGRIDDPSSPSPRPMDTLEVELRNGDEIWVKFLNFRSGPAEKLPA